MYIQDYPMSCCGMLQARMIYEGVKKSGWENSRYGDYPTWTEKDWEDQFAKIEKQQREWRRNCAMITLSSEQREAQKHAVRLGWKAVHEFYNPNSLNMVTIYVKTLWDSAEEYNEEVNRGEYEAPYRGTWINNNTDEEELEI